MYTAISVGILGLAALLAVRSWWKPGYALALMWSTYAVEQILQFGLPAFTSNVQLANILITLAVSAVACKYLLAGKIDATRLPMELVLLLALVALCGISILWSIAPKISVEKLQDSGPYILAFAVVAPLCGYNHAELSNAVKASIWFGGAVIVAHALCPAGFRGLEIRVGLSEIAVLPLAIADYGALVATLTLFDMVRDRKGMFLNIARAGIVLVSIWIIIRSGSRGQMIAFAIANFVWLPIGGKLALKRSAIVGLATGAMAAGIGIWMVGKLATTERWDWDRIVSSASGRQNMALGLLDYWSHSDAIHWIVGLGSSTSFKIMGFYPHNVPAEVLVEEGLIGFALFAMFIYTGYSSIYRGMRYRNLSSEQRMNFAGIAAVITMYLVISLKQGSFLGSHHLMSMVVTIGWVCGRLSIPVGNERPVSQSLRRRR